VLVCESSGAALMGDFYALFRYGLNVPFAAQAAALGQPGWHGTNAPTCRRDDLSLAGSGCEKPRAPRSSTESLSA